ncbi:hypothetical protein HDU83_008892 [Entophlyctis luteolus]|nr:hypothetical protein HDU83_008892 [Entophlyctis luteolus]
MWNQSLGGGGVDEESEDFVPFDCFLPPTIDRHVPIQSMPSELKKRKNHGSNHQPQTPPAAHSTQARDQGAVAASPPSISPSKPLPEPAADDQQKKRDSSPAKPAAPSLDAIIDEGFEREAQWSFLWTAGLIVVTVLAILTRIYRIQDPAKVVFDEVHFGKFASFYLRGEYYFDVHPPLGKMILGAVAALAGYDGHYLFDEIGDDYVVHGVPWITMRMFPAVCGALIVPFSFMTLRELGLSWSGAMFGALMLVFDNAMITQSRLILLDSMLLLFGVTSVYAWVRFYRERTSPFSLSWWFWLTMTGVSLALTLGIKMVGLFTIGVIGIAVLFDLWRILDLDRGLTMAEFYKHFAARALCLIVLPISLYLSFFYVHFALLPYSGPGDAFMSPRFQATLLGNEMLTKSLPIPYNSQVSLKNKNQACFLHSHDAHYPLTYENGHVSSEGQQVTGYMHPDGNNMWEIIPARDNGNPPVLDADEKKNGIRYLRNGDVVRFMHIGTGNYLLTHDVASPLTSTNMEITAVTPEEAEKRYEETLWQINSKEDKIGERLKTMRSLISVTNVKHQVVLLPNAPLPSWGFAQTEINGEKKLDAKGATWYFEEVVHDSIVDGVDIYGPPVQPNTKRRGEMPFLSKFLELQNLMFVHNAALTTSHPYSSTPGSWPFVSRGVSFWETKDGLRQIYLLGNPAIWWFSISSVGVFVVVWLIDRIVLRRQVDLLGPSLRKWFDNAIGFLFVAWLLHYIPFFLMGRMLFLHHYLPSFIFSTMLAAALMDFLFRLCFERGPLALAGGDKMKAMRIPVFAWAKSGPFGGLLYVGLLIGVMSVFLGVFNFFMPLSYGYGFADVEELRKRKWFKSWDLQYA